MPDFLPLLLAGSVTESATIIASSQVATLPVARVASQSPKATWRSTDTTDQVITLTWPTPQVIGGLSLINLNSTAANIEFRLGLDSIQNGMATMIGAPGLLPYGYASLPDNDVIDSAIITLQGDPIEGYHEVGRILAAPQMAVNNVIDNTWNIQFEDTAQESQNANNQAPTILKGDIRRIVSVQYVHLSEMDAMQSFVHLGAVLGRAHDVFLVPRTEGDFPGWQAIHGLPTVGGVQRNTNLNDQWSVPVTIKELVSGGASVAAADNIVAPGTTANQEPTATDFVI